MILLKLISITFILVMGLKIAMSNDMLLEKIGNYFEDMVDKGYKIFELFICPWCMPTLFSIVAHGFAIGLAIIPMEWNWQLLIRWPLIFMASSFLCGNAWNIYETINRIREKNEAQANYFNSLFEEENQN